MKRLLLPLAALAIAGLLLGSAPRAYACSCAELPTGDSAVRRLLAEVDLVAIGAVRAPEPDDEYSGQLHIEIETMFVGPDVDDVALEQPWGSGLMTEGYGPDCSFTLAEVPGRRYFLMLQGEKNGSYAAGWCSSFRLDGPPGYPPAEQRVPFLEALQRVTEASEPPEARDQVAPSEDGGFPWRTVAIAATASAGALGAAAWLVRRASRG
jgi:hypothetical protein